MRLALVLVPLLALAVAVGIVGGWKGLAVLAFFGAIAGGLALAAGVGGEWIRDVSARRFDRHDRR